MSGHLREEAAAEASAKCERRRMAWFMGGVSFPLPIERDEVASDTSDTDREPCFWCGARGDAGCGHRRVVAR